MNLKLYNTKTRQKELFEPAHDNITRMYSCGPTVYSSAHIGNMRSNMLADFVKRTLKFLGTDVQHVMNITDVGHLISATGQDKMEKAARETSKSAIEIANKYTEEFMSDLKELNIIPADNFPRATEYIEQQIELVQKLEKKGYTYRISDGIYFDTSKFTNYGTLSGQNLEDKEEGARVKKNPEKKNASDFVLWKFSPKDEQRQMEWDSPWGKGFPGWHIECSAMSTALLGQPIDIHTGGIDLLPVHHENETAQSEAAQDTEFVRFWLHGEFVDLAGEKMAKSDGNIITVSTIIEKGYNPLAYRYLALNTHYRSKLNFTFEALDAAQNALNNIRDTVRTWKSPSEPDQPTLDQFTTAIKDDLQLPQALAITQGLIKSNLDSSVKSATLLIIDNVLGLKLDQWIAKPIKAPADVIELAEQRQQARAEKNFKKSDQLREQIEQKGYLVKDQPENYTLTEK